MDTETKGTNDMPGTDAPPCPYAELAKEAWESSASYDGTPWDETEAVEIELREKKKDLVIMVLTDFSRFGDTAVAHAVAVSMIFHAELCLFPLTPVPERQNENMLHSFQVAERQGVPITWHAYDARLKERLYASAEEINAMMMVIGVDPTGKEGFFTRHKALRYILPSRIPVLCVGGEWPRPDAYRSILLPLDTSVYSKEKALWAGYFHRFYHADIHLLYKNYKDNYLEQKVKSNIAFTEKIYRNLEIPCTHHAIADCWEEVESHAIGFAPEIHASLMVCMTTKYPTPVDLLCGRKEKKLMKHVDKLPLLFINQRDDLYVLCT